MHMCLRSSEQDVFWEKDVFKVLRSTHLEVLPKGTQ